MLNRIFNRVFARDDCISDLGANICDKPSTNSPVTYIVIGAVSGVILLALIITLTIFQRRRTKRDKKEWTKNPQELDDYGMGTVTTVSSKPLPNAPFTGSADSQARQENLGVPYNRTSADSTQSLAQSLRHGDNPFADSKAQLPRSMV